MKAMIFAAGRGERMGELTRLHPKPMLEAGGKPLIQHTVERLAVSGFSDLVINIAYLGEQIRDYLGDGSRFGVDIVYSHEPYPLETGGAIAHALPLLDARPFALVNADVWTDYPFERLRQEPLAEEELGRLVMVPNPPHLPGGDFYLNESGRLKSDSKEQPRFTYSGIAVLHPDLVAQYPQRREIFPLGEVFRAAMAKDQLAGEVHHGQWRDIGTPERLKALQDDLAR